MERPVFVIPSHTLPEIWFHSFEAPPQLLRTRKGPKRTGGVPASPVALKTSLDRLGCSWKPWFRCSRRQSHLRGKSGEKKALRHVWTLPPPSSFLSSPDCAGSHKDNRVASACATPDLLRSLVGGYIVYSSKEQWKREKTLPPQTNYTGLVWMGILQSFLSISNSCKFTVFAISVQPWALRPAFILWILNSTLQPWNFLLLSPSSWLKCQNRLFLGVVHDRVNRAVQQQRGAHVPRRWNHARVE